MPYLKNVLQWKESQNRDPNLAELSTLRVLKELSEKPSVLQW